MASFISSLMPMNTGLGQRGISGFETGKPNVSPLMNTLGGRVGDLPSWQLPQSPGMQPTQPQGQAAASQPDSPQQTTTTTTSESYDSSGPMLPPSVSAMSDTPATPTVSTPSPVSQGGGDSSGLLNSLRAMAPQASEPQESSSLESVMGMLRPLAQRSLPDETLKLSRRSY